LPKTQYYNKYIEDLDEPELKIPMSEINIIDSNYIIGIGGDYVMFEGEVC